MGHIRLGRLPNTPNWRKVVGLVADDAPVASVAAATMSAAQRGLEIADSDEGLRHTFWLLTQITLAAREDHFAAALNQAGVSVPDG